VKTHQGTSKVTGETNKDQNQINGQLKASHTFHQTLGVHNRKPNTRAQRVLEKLKSFNSVTQTKPGRAPAAEINTRKSQAMILTGRITWQFNYETKTQ
jgi:hypothetical protein